MANVTTELKVVVKAVGQNELKQLQGALTDLGRKAAEPAKINFKELSVELKKYKIQQGRRLTICRHIAMLGKILRETLKLGLKNLRRRLQKRRS